VASPPQQQHNTNHLTAKVARSTWKQRVRWPLLMFSWLRTLVLTVSLHRDF